MFYVRAANDLEWTIEIRPRRKENEHARLGVSTVFCWSDLIKRKHSNMDAISSGCELDKGYVIKPRLVSF
jgi:hypothetical protein